MWMSSVPQIDDALLKFRHLGYKEMNKKMHAAKLDVQTVLKTASTSYRKLKDDGEWPAAANAMDSRALKRGYGASANMAAAVNALKQVLDINQNGRKLGPCFECGGEHLVKDCPQKKNSGKKHPKQSGRKFSNPKKAKGKRDDRGGRGRKGIPLPPPRDGESETREYKGKTHHYCKKCGRWTLSHTTKDHRSKEELDRAKVGMTKVHFDMHPAAFVTKVNVNEAKGSTKGHGGAKLLTAIAMLGIAVACFTSTAWIEFAEYLYSVVTMSLYDVWTVSMNLSTVIGSNWLPCTLAGLSGSVGTYTFMQLYKMTDNVEPDRARQRQGPNALKQKKRWIKKHMVKRRVAKRRVGKQDIRNQETPIEHGNNDGYHTRTVYTRHPRFRHVPRPKRHEVPRTERIQNLRRLIRELEDDISNLRLLIRRKEATLREANDELKKLTRKPRTPAYCCSHKHCCKECPTSLVQRRSSEGGKGNKKTPRKPTPRAPTPKPAPVPSFVQADISKAFIQAPLAEPSAMVFTPIKSTPPKSQDPKVTEEDLKTHFGSFPEFNKRYQNDKLMSLCNHIYIDPNSGKISVKISDRTYGSHSQLPRDQMFKWTLFVDKMEGNVKQWNDKFVIRDKALALKRPPFKEPYDIKEVVRFIHMNRRILSNSSDNRFDDSIEFVYMSNRGMLNDNQDNSNTQTKRPDEPLPEMWKSAMEQELQSVEQKQAFKVSKVKKYEPQSMMTKNKRGKSRVVPNPKAPTVKNMFPPIGLSDDYFKVPAWVNAITDCFFVSKISSGKGVPTRPVLFDSGANCCITPSRSDFVGKYQTINDGPEVEGIGQGLQIQGTGTVAWTFKSETGMYRTLKLPCYYVPDSENRIASVKKILEQYPKERVTIANDGLVLSGHGQTPGIRVPFCSKSALPLAQIQEKTQKHKAYRARKQSSNSNYRHKLQ
jgi:hypothetical protein